MEESASAGMGLNSYATRVRRATSSDAGAVSDLLRRAFQEFEPFYTKEAFVATVQPESGVLMRLEEGPLWIAESEQGVIGTVAAVFSESAGNARAAFGDFPSSRTKHGSVARSSGECLMIRGMAVDPIARGQKIGRLLLCTTEDFAREQRVGQMSLFTTAFLLGAIGLYQSAGFEFTGEKACPHGTELLRMVKILDNYE